MSFVYVNCTCNRSWSSVLPPPPCPAHSGSQPPFRWADWTGTWTEWPAYVGRHRKPAPSGPKPLDWDF